MSNSHAGLTEKSFLLLLKSQDLTKASIINLMGFDEVLSHYQI